MVTYFTKVYCIPGRVVPDAVLGLLWYDGVADRQQSEELPCRPVPGPSQRGQVRVFPALAALPLWIEHLSRNAALLVLHHVPRQRPRLVTENVLDLPKFLVQVGGPRQRVGINLQFRVSVVHSLVPIDEHCLDELDDLQCDLQ